MLSKKMILFHGVTMFFMSIGGVYCRDGKFDLEIKCPKDVTIRAPYNNQSVFSDRFVTIYNRGCRENVTSFTILRNSSDISNQKSWEQPDDCEGFTEYYWSEDVQLQNTAIEVGGQVSMPTLCISNAGNISFDKARNNCQ